ncbi:MAG: bifunctional 4-hydroxy-2-oxoglutarate aldolase/2-dehydro-3-deoxy-phosphogluconate aldolase [Pseudomonadota bacterium]
MNANPTFLNGAKIIPVLSVTDLEDAVPLAKALVAGGLKYLEVTLRTDVAYDAIARMSESVPDAIVGVGSVRFVSELERAVAVGAQFAVSPGAERALIEAGLESPIPFLPGAATASEVMTLLAAGYSFQKFFPAEINGGVPALKAFSGPLGQVSFCPTGGVKPENALDYLNLSNVVCVGGSWMVPQQAVAEKNWQEIESLSQKAASLTS